ncbi:MAG: hypothetical protein KBS95_06720 [Alistipes sp.]|nr:hypothetical protein [Candidatus Alistipes equi]
MDEKIEELLVLSKQIADNAQQGSDLWRNLRLVKEVYEKLVSLPLDYNEEVNAPNRVEFIENLLSCVNELDMPRASLRMREYQKSILESLPSCKVEIKSIDGDIQLLRDYLNMKISVKEWCQKYGRHLLFDDVERSLKWEENIFEVEQEINKELQNEPRGMGFCFVYWSKKRSALLRRGIEWRSPRVMNPRVMFD